MTEVIELESYRVARVLINALDTQAVRHAETMVRRMRRRRDGDGEVQWLRIYAAIAKLHRGAFLDVSRAL
ncbi:MAG: hypothetical protein HYU60_04805 [Magnetospirillum sp.]|nr:hypothetical protein [Magnetospirillum sp.]